MTQGFQELDSPVIFDACPGLPNLEIIHIVM
jgi:hypothetical protein